MSTNNSTGNSQSIYSTKDQVCLRPGCNYCLANDIFILADSNSVRYESLNPSVASISEDGRLCALSYGQAIIKVSLRSDPTVYTYVTVCVSECGCDCGCDYDDCADTVCVSHITFTNTPSSPIFVGARGFITTNVYPSNATDKAIAYFTSDSSVLSCFTSGYYVAKKSGSVTITARANNGVSASKTYKVEVAPESITVNAEEITLKPGETFEIVPEIQPSTASQEFIINSNDSSVASVDPNGFVFANQCGTAIITVSAGSNTNIYTTVTVNVSEEDTVIVANESFTSPYSVRNDEVASTHEIGPNATGMVDLRNGRLKFDITDFAWEGLIAPVTIKHLYTSALKDTFFTAGAADGLAIKDYSQMKLGYGWRLNYMVSLEESSETIDGEAVTVYTLVDREGNIYKLYPTESANIYADKVNAGVTLEITDDGDKYVTVGSDCYCQLDDGYLWYIYDTTTGEEHNDQAKIRFTYTVSAGDRVSKIKDGSDREFQLEYQNSKGTLKSITAPDGSVVSYIYDDDYELLTQIVYPRGESLVFEYDTDNHIISVCMQNGDNCEYKVVYDYTDDSVTSVTEYGADNVRGRVIEYTYRGDCTKVTTKEYADTGAVETVVENTFVFDNNGDIISSYAEHNDFMQSNVAEDNYGSVETGETHSYENCSLNLLLGHGFDNSADLEQWSVSMTGIAEVLNTEHPNKEAHKHLPHDGNGCLHLVATDNGAGSTLHQSQYLPAGEYTFSAYVRAVSASEAEGGTEPGVYLTVYGADGSGADSIKVSDTGNGYLRLFASFTSNTEQKVTVVISVDGDGEYYVDSAQLEHGSAPGAYNAVENGSFQHGTTGWSRVDNGIGSVTVVENLDALSGTMKVKMGDDYDIMPYQYVPIKSYKNTRTTFTLSGFAKLKEKLETDDSEVYLRLRACITYVGDESPEWQFEQHCANFSKVTDEWQYASITFTKEQFRTIENIAVSCEYFSLNSDKVTNTFAYFDSVALTVGDTEYNLTADDFSVTNYHDDDTNTCDIEEDAGFEEVIGKYNLTLTNTTYSEEALGTIYRAEVPSTPKFIGYEKSIDSRGNETVYTLDENTSRVTKVVDREGNITTYSYDAAGNVTQMCQYDENMDNAAGVDFTYDSFNELKTVTRSDGMAYCYDYNEFHRPESISIDGKGVPLVQYAYKNRNGSLKKITYANGHIANLKYDRFGRLIRETWENAHSTVTHDTKYSYDGNGNPVSVLDITNEIEYNYIYENGRLVCVAQSEGVHVGSNGYKYAGTLVCKTLYRYNTDGQITQRIVSDSTGAFVEKYTYTDKGEVTVTLSNGAKFRSRNDALGRVAFDELQIGTGTLSREFKYHNGAVSEMHEAGGKIYSSPTTELVKTITHSDGSEQTYEYDKEERIIYFKGTSNLNEFAGGVGNGYHESAYEYDCHGQLVKETYTDYNGIETVTAVTYDKAGNILTKGGNVYTYGNSAWKDMLTEYNGKPIYYDSLGNPTNYLGNVMTWASGRRLVSYCGDAGGEEAYTTYTYNSLGQRIGKTVGGNKCSYVYDGTRLVKEIHHGTETDTVVEFFYDASDSPIGMKYGDTTYYYKKNLQGDIIELLDETGAIFAEYVYNAWGELIGVRAANVYNMTTALKNPFRYRGYYYDNETGFYYLQSRYYDPVVGRFINADETMFLGVSGTATSYNLYAYCENNVINDIDVTGTISLNSIKNALLKPINALINKVKEMINKIKVTYQSGVLKISTGAIAIAIDAISFAISKISHFAVKTGLKILIAWAKSNTTKFFAFAKQYIIDNAMNLVISFLKFLCKKMAISITWSKFTNKVGDALFGSSKLYRIYNAFSSFGNIIATIFDLLDGEWDDKLAIKIR